MLRVAHKALLELVSKSGKKGRQQLQYDGGGNEDKGRISGNIGGGITVVQFVASSSEHCALCASPGELCRWFHLAATPETRIGFLKERGQSTVSHTILRHARSLSSAIKMMIQAAHSRVVSDQDGGIWQDVSLLRLNSGEP